MNKINVFMALLVLGGCQKAPDFAPCSDVDCSGHGTCLTNAVDDEVIPTCKCDTGYSPTPSGWLCLPTNQSSLCAQVTCSGHGTCASIKGAARCICDVGYQLGSTGLTCEDPCAKISCSGHGTCKLKSNKPYCLCSAGYRNTATGNDCEAIPTNSNMLLGYQLYWDSLPTHKMGRILLDLSQLSAGTLTEEVSFGTTYLSRKVRQVWSLDSSGKETASMTFEDRLTQRKVSRSRKGSATFGSGTGSMTYQRAGKVATTKVTYTGSKRPVPMLGGFEFPGWSFGCFSVMFYIQALDRFDATKSGVQYLEVYYPTSGWLSRVKMQAGKGSTTKKPVIDFPEHQITVTYSGSYPQTIKLTGENMSWSLSTATPADLNLDQLKDGTAWAPTALPTDLVATTQSFDSADKTALAGTLTLPKAPSGKVPAVLMVSDMMTEDRDRPFMYLPGSPLYAHLAAYLAKAGYATLRYDPRGRGKSKGDATKITMATMTADAKAALSTLSATTGVDSSKIYLLSHGTSSMVALSLLKQGSAAAGYIALTPVIEDMDLVTIYGATEHIVASGFWSSFINAQKKYYTKKLEEIADGTTTDSDFRGLPVTLWKELLAFDGAATLGAFTGPVLVMQGDQDLVIPATQVTAATAAAKVTGKTNLTTQTLTGLTFDFSEGKKSTLWETAMLPLDLPAAAQSAITTWIKAN